MSEKQAKYGEQYIKLSIEERRLLDSLPDWGEATVVMKNGIPVLLKLVREDIKLTD